MHGRQHVDHAVFITPDTVAYKTWHAGCTCGFRTTVFYAHNAVRKAMEHHFQTRRR